MAAFARLAQFEYGAARHDFAAVAQERLDDLLQVQQLGLAVDNRHHVDAEAVLHLGVFVQLVQDHVGVLAALQLDHRAHAGLVRLVANFGNAFDALLAHHLADLHQQGGLVHLVGQFVDDDGLTVALADILEVGAGAHHHAAAAGAVAFLHASQTVDEAGGREVRRGHQFDQAARYPCPGSRSSARQASTTSVMLCGGILVAIPTAIPEEPFTSRLGKRDGNTSGSCSEPS